MHLYQKYLLVMITSLLFAGLYFYFKQQDLVVDRVADTLLVILDKKVEEEKRHAFAFAFALSQNETLRKAIKDGDREKSHLILKEYMETLEVFGGTSINVQVVSKDYHLFARSWDSSERGLDILKYRPDLMHIAKTKKPQLSYEATRRLVLIASIPLLVDGEVDGFIEVIEQFDDLEDYLARYDVELIVLLDKKYKKRTVLLQSRPQIGEFVVANKDANIHHISYLQEVGVDELLKKGILKGEGCYYFAKNILNSDGKRIGNFVLVLSQKKVELFSAYSQSLSAMLAYTQKDHFNTQVLQDRELEIFDDFSDEELLRLKKSMRKEDKERLKVVLREHLKSYSKEELIVLLLDINSNRKIRGEIK